MQLITTNTGNKIKLHTRAITSKLIQTETSFLLQKVKSEKSEEKNKVSNYNQNNHNIVE